MKYNVVSNSIIEQRFDEVEEDIEDPESVQAKMHNSGINTFASKNYLG